MVTDINFNEILLDYARQHVLAGETIDPKTLALMIETRLAEQHEAFAAIEKVEKKLEKLGIMR